MTSKRKTLDWGAQFGTRTVFLPLNRSFMTCKTLLHMQQSFVI
jgi:hypothetical protein